MIVLARASRPIDRRIKHWNISIWFIVSYKESGEQAKVEADAEEEEEVEAVASNEMKVTHL
jgi:hypothetical protein